MADEFQPVDLTELTELTTGVTMPAPGPQQLAADPLTGVVSDVSGTPLGATGPPGLAGSDSGHPLGAPLAAAAQVGGAGGGYTVDPERAPQVIANLRAAADLLGSDLRLQVERLADIEPPGDDKVSMVATEAFREIAVGSTGLRTALLATAQEFHRQADKLQADLLSYLQTEEANVALPVAQPMDFWRKA